MLFRESWVLRHASLLTANGDHGNITHALSPAEEVPRSVFVELFNSHQMTVGNVPDRLSLKGIVTLRHALVPLVSK